MGVVGQNRIPGLVWSFPHSVILCGSAASSMATSPEQTELEPALSEVLPEGDGVFGEKARISAL